MAPNKLSFTERLLHDIMVPDKPSFNESLWPGIMISEKLVRRKYRPKSHQMNRRSPKVYGPASWYQINSRSSKISPDIMVSGKFSFTKSLSPDIVLSDKLSLIDKKIIKLILRQPGISMQLKKPNLDLVTKSP